MSAVRFRHTFCSMIFVFSGQSKIINLCFADAFCCCGSAAQRYLTSCGMPAMKWLNRGGADFNSSQDAIHTVSFPKIWLYLNINKTWAGQNSKHHTSKSYSIHEQNRWYFQTVSESNKSWAITSKVPFVPSQIVTKPMRHSAPNVRSQKITGQIVLSHSVQGPNHARPNCQSAHNVEYQTSLAKVETGPKCH